jgi:deoxyribodipyrimidine photo-lyase
VEEVLKVAEEVGAGRIYYNEDYLPYPLQRDAELKRRAQEIGKEAKGFEDILLVRPDRVLSEAGKPYTVFTPFKRRWLSALRLPQRQEITPHASALKQPNLYPSLSLPTLQDFGMTLTQLLAPAGEAAAQQRLADFERRGLPHYHLHRNNASDPEGTSRLSVYLKWGNISVRDCFRAAQRVGGEGAEKWIDELAWREFFYHVAYHFPHVLEKSMLSDYDRFEWSDSREHLEAWKEGQTGYPFVDAGMRQLKETGWMHNRLRQVVASYLCKDLCISWQEGERYFMQMLVDGDWASNNGGWQWVAGTGTDPRRATRIFNPVLQQERYDPHCDYVRQWVPEFGTSRYPQPIVTHEAGRQEFLRRYRRMKSAETGQVSLFED